MIVKRSRWRTIWHRLLVYVASSVVGLSSIAAATTCAAPTLRFADARNLEAARPGARLNIVGEGWIRCPSDDGGCDFGGDNDGSPYSGVDLFLRGPISKIDPDVLEHEDVADTEIVIKVVTFDASESGSIDTAVIVPDVQPGRYFLGADFGEPLTLMVLE